jgi:hypothetical protein
MRKNSGFSLFFGKEFLTNYLHRYVSTATPISTLASMKRFQLRWDSCRISSPPHAATHHYARINGQVPILIIFVDVFFWPGDYSQWTQNFAPLPISNIFEWRLY